MSGPCSGFDGGYFLDVPILVYPETKDKQTNSGCMIINALTVTATITLLSSLQFNTTTHAMLS